MGLMDWFRRKPAVKAPPRLQRFGSFSGAQTNRLVEDWVATWMAARDENRWELRLLRIRSREQCRNNPVARRYLALLDENVLGPKGITLQAQEMTAAGEPDEETNQQIEAAWEEWGDADTCTVDGRLCWREFQGAVLEAVARDGECLVERVPGFNNAFGFALRLWDIDLLDENYNVAGGEGRNAVVQGVELNQWGRPLAYHLWTEHPQALITLSSKRRVRVPAANMRHFGRQHRAGQVRYEPWLTPVLIPLRMLDEYQNAELVAARAGAENLGFIQKGMNAVQPDPNDPFAANRVMETSKGQVRELGPDETFQPWTSTHPGVAFKPFQEAVLRQIAAGLGVSYSSLTGDLSNANYSSMRVGMLGERDNYEILQGWLSENLHEWVYESWLRQAVMWQQVRLPGRLAEAGEPLWQARGWDWVDPQKDVTASLIEAGAGLNSLTRIAASKGLDFRTILQERKREQELADEAGVKITLGVPGETVKQAGAAAVEDAAAANENTGGTNGAKAPAA